MKENNIDRAKRLFPDLCAKFSDSALEVLIDEHLGVEDDAGWMETILTIAHEFHTLDDTLIAYGCATREELADQCDEIVDFVDGPHVLII